MNTKKTLVAVIAALLVAATLPCFAKGKVVTQWKITDGGEGIFVTFYSDKTWDLVDTYEDGSSEKLLEGTYSSGALTEENVRTLLRWKSPRWLSLDSGKVRQVLARLDDINAFRAGRQDALAPFFGGSGVYDVFIKHMARPTEYPIYDRHVLNAYCRFEKGLADGTSTATRSCSGRASGRTTVRRSRT